MPTREVLDLFATSDPETMGVGPLHEHVDHVPQSLLDRQHNLAAKPNKETCYSPSQTIIDHAPEEHARVRSTGARTPGSLAAEIRAQIKRRTDSKENKMVESK